LASALTSSSGSRIARGLSIAMGAESMDANRRTRTGTASSAHAAPRDRPEMAGSGSRTACPGRAKRSMRPASRQ
jgi:hypothetical protein